MRNRLFTLPLPVPRIARSLSIPGGSVLACAVARLPVPAFARRRVRGLAAFTALGIRAALAALRSIGPWLFARSSGILPPQETLPFGFPFVRLGRLLHSGLGPGTLRPLDDPLDQALGRL